MKATPVAISLLCVLVAAYCSPAASGVEVATAITKAEEKQHPALAILKLRLRELLDSMAPEARVEYEDDRLVAHLRTATYLVHGQDKNGAFREKPSPQIGPKVDGFRLVATVHPRTDRDRRAAFPIGPALNISKHPQPYWTDLQITSPLGRTEEDLWVSFAHGSRLDSELENKIVQAVAAMARGFGQTRAEAEQTLANRLETEITIGGLSQSPISDALRHVLPQHGVPFRVDREAFEAAGIDLQKRQVQTPPVQRETVRALLKRLLTQIPATYTIDGDTIVIRPANP